MKQQLGRVTVPAEKGFEGKSKEIVALWGADAVRNSDGTSLPENPKSLGVASVYQTYFVVRGDNAWADTHPEEAMRLFLMSSRVVAKKSPLVIDPLEGYFREQIALDLGNQSHWQVYDRTTGKEIQDFTIDGQGLVHLDHPALYHEYTVDFVAKSLWHPTQLYNYVTNHWTCEKQKMYDPAFPLTSAYTKQHLAEWCVLHPEVTVVRFTTFFYQFSLLFNGQGKEKYVDWFGYGLTGNLALQKGFAEKYGYALKAEDLVDDGCYNNPFRLPKKAFLDYQDYVSSFVASQAHELVEIAHAHGKEAMMFLGDDWIGTEPYGPYFPSIGLDAVVGSVGGGVTVRMLAEIPGVKIHEGRFLPYFFPDTFYEGNEQGALEELNRNWRTARRAMLRKPLERMGFGGYLSLAAKFPSFVNRVADCCQEFREIDDKVLGKKPYCALKVGILNAWGSLRSWMCHMVAHELWYQQIYSYQGVLEALSGLPVEVQFLSFDDIRKKGVPSGLDVLVNVGMAGSAYSGGKEWKDATLTSRIREFVARGGGFLGVGEPTAYEQDGEYFALRDVLGVDEERGFTLSEDKYNIEEKASFITADLTKPFDAGEGQRWVYALPGADVLAIAFSPRYQRSVNVGEVLLASNDYELGRGVYFAGLPYSVDNARLFYRALLYAAHKEGLLHKSFSANPLVEASYYPETGLSALVNNSQDDVTTLFYDEKGQEKKVTVPGNSILWLGKEDCH
jgi:1,3-beta-galactosyl-N-acetylhexosamine phosphorylase